MTKLPNFKMRSGGKKINIKINPFFLAEILYESEEDEDHLAYREMLSSSEARRMAKYLIECANWQEANT